MSKSYTSKEKLQILSNMPLEVRDDTETAARAVHAEEHARKLLSLYQGERSEVQKLKDDLAQEKRREQLQSLEAKQNRVRAAEYKDHGIKIRCTCQRWKATTGCGVDHHLLYCPLFSINEESSQAEEVEDLGVHSMAAQLQRPDEQQVRESKSSVEEAVNQQLSLLEEHLEDILSATRQELPNCDMGPSRFTSHPRGRCPADFYRR
jgi:hypothetical protein